MKNEKKQIILNGKQYKFIGNFTVSWLFDYLAFNTSVIVLDYNGRILPKEMWGKTIIKQNDLLEILTVAGGG